MLVLAGALVLCCHSAEYADHIVLCPPLGFQVAYLVTRDIDGNLLLDTEDVHKKISTAKLVSD